MRRYIEWLIAQGVHGLYPNGSTGEFTRFTPQERRRIVKIVCEQAAGRVLQVLAGAKPKRTPAKRFGPVKFMRNTSGAVGRDRVAVLLPAWSGIGVRLLSRDR